MEILTSILQLVVPLGILNVWLLRKNRSTNYRGGDAPNLKAEFQAYGLPEWAYFTVGFLKLSAAAMLLVGFLVPALVVPGASLMAVLMLGAVAMHAKVGDPAIRYVPASLVLIMSLGLIFPEVL
ncbi:MAG TPA: DoxX family protein [Opitutales bacterium]|nr:DoxX family protein [Opitutales bacterium]